MTSSPKPLLSQVAWVSAGRIGAALIQALSILLVIQLLLPAEFGLLSGVLSLATVAQTTVDMGVSTFISRERAADPGSGSIATALKFNALSSILLSALVAVALIITWRISDNIIYLFMLPLAFWVSGERNADARLAVVFADGDAKINVINLLSRRTFAVILFVSLAAVGLEPVLAFALGSALAALASSLFANIYVRKRVTASPSISYRALLRASWPYWLHSAATQARNFDVVLISAIAGPAQAGYYSTASRLTNPLTLLTSSLASTLLPASSRASAAASSLGPLLRIATVIVGTMTVIYAVIFFSIPLLVTTVLPPAYASASVVIQLVVAGLPFAAISSIASAVLQGAGMKHAVATASTITTVLCLLLIAFASYHWGAVGGGAAFSATLFIQACVLIGVFIVLRRRRRAR